MLPTSNLIGISLEADPSASLVGCGLLLLRVVTGLMIFYVHGWHKLLGGIAYFKNGAPWELRDAVAGMHAPAPTFSALAATAVQFVCSLLLVVGLLTRIDAVLLAGALAGAVAQNLMAKRSPQLATLYLLNVVTLAIMGPGQLSLDAKLFGP